MMGVNAGNDSCGIGLNEKSLSIYAEANKRLLSKQDTR